MKTGIGTRPCSCTANLAHVHENWAKTWCAHVILAKKHSAGQHRVKRTFGQNGHRDPTLLMYSSPCSCTCKVGEHAVRACDFGQKTQRGATSCKTDFRAKRASVPDLAHVQLTLLMYMKTGRKHGARM